MKKMLGFVMAAGFAGALGFAVAGCGGGAKESTGPATPASTAQQGGAGDPNGGGSSAGGSGQGNMQGSSTGPTGGGGSNSAAQGSQDSSPTTH
jgi:hypothetical protein